ncbi:MAG TPA: DUF5916 domain-containing protein [Thermoanaerobaculia bacterium]|nr:DUF5916 domain-containing protein [Thermoanaerobaculia bacterium]
MTDRKMGPGLSIFAERKPRRELARWLAALAAAALAFVSVPGASAQPPPPPPAAAAGQTATGALPPRNHFSVEPATSPIRVDGVLDEAAWATATVIPLTREWFPSYNAEPLVKTECLVTFDSEYLYVAFRAHDPEPAHIRAHLADRDPTAFLDDTVGFYIDTFNDRRRAFEFRINPLGVQTDATVSDTDGSEDFSWDAIWDAAGRITADGYVVEVAVPFKQLRFPRGAQAQAWGFLASRSYPRSVIHELRSSYNDRGQTCLVCQFDTLTGFRQIDTGHNLEVVPTVTAQRTDERPDLTSPIENGSAKVKLGLSTRWGITPNVTLSATVNPDFSQVEADAAQLNVNETFALFFPEKRPFFLEGADYFTTLYPIVFTRTVADPKAGLKLTGKEGPNAFGMFVAQDRINNLIFPGPEGSGATSLEEDVTSAVVRYRRDVGQTSTLGFLYTGRQSTDYFNHVVGLDGNLRPSAANTFRFQYLTSRTDYPEAVARDNGQPLGSFGGNMWQVAYIHSTRDWLADASYDSRSTGFRADSGFVPQVNFREAGWEVQRTFWGEPGGWYSRFIVNLNASRNETQEGHLLNEKTLLFLTYEGPLQSSARLRILPNWETFQGVEYKDFRRDLLVSIQPTGDLGLSLFIRGGQIIDVVNSRQTHFDLLEPRIEFKLGRKFSGEVDHTWQAFYVHGDQFLRVNLFQATLRYNLTARTFFRAIVQYRDVGRNLALYNPGIELPAREKSLLSQFLFSYKVNPRTVLLVGYSDTLEGDETVDLIQRNRAFFLKIGYAWLW